MKKTCNKDDYYCFKNDACVSSTKFTSSGSFYKKGTTGFLPAITVCELQDSISQFALLTENGEELITENGELIILENA